MALRWKSKILLAKLEESYGVDPAPAGANAVVATDIQLQPMEGDDVSRNLEYPWLGAQASIPTALRSVLTFSTEFVPSGTAGVAPAWGPLLCACGAAETIVEDTSVTYEPVSSAMESIAIYFWIDNLKHVLLGARGTAVLTVNAQGIPVIRWTFTGRWVQPTNASATAPDLSDWKPPLIATTVHTPTFTINAVPLVMRSFSLTFGNQVEPHLLVGLEEIIISDRAEEIATQVEAVALSSLNPFALANDQTQVAVELVHGTAAGLIATISAPTCQMKRLSGYENQQNVLEWPLRLAPLPSTGNDQWSIALT
jgi:hypothetical protein